MQNDTYLLSRCLLCIYSRNDDIETVCQMWASCMLSEYPSEPTFEVFGIFDMSEEMATRCVQTTCMSVVWSLIL